MMYVLVCGSRTWTDAEMIAGDLEWLVASGDEVRVVHGAAVGADSMGAATAVRLGCRVKAMPADWKGHGRSAGFRRNEAMAELLKGKRAQGHRVGVLAYQVDRSRGTQHMIELAERAGLEVVVRDEESF